MIFLIKKNNLNNYNFNNLMLMNVYSNKILYLNFFKSILFTHNVLLKNIILSKYFYNLKHNSCFFNLNLKSNNLKFNFFYLKYSSIFLTNKQIYLKLFENSKKNDKNFSTIQNKSLKFFKISFLFFLKFIFNNKHASNLLFFFNLLYKNYLFFSNIKYFINSFIKHVYKNSLLNIDRIQINWFPKISKSLKFKSKKSIKKRLKKNFLYNFKFY